MMNVQIKLLNKGCTPSKAHTDDAGFDLRANIKERISIGQFSTVKVPTGICVAVPTGYVGFVLPRGGHASKGITVETPPIDTGYTGEVFALVTNNCAVPYHMQPFERFCQLVIMPLAQIDTLEFVNDLPKSERGNGALNSTGKD